MAKKQRARARERERERERESVRAGGIGEEDAVVLAMQSPSGMAGDGQQWMMMQQQQQQQQYMQAGIQHEDVKTLWIGDLQYWMDESYLYAIFSYTGEVISVKVIRNKQTGYSEGYGFIEFVSHAAAERVLQAYNGTQMPQTEQPFRFNWASFGIGEKRPEGGYDHSIFVGDLAPDVTDYILQETFRSRYPSVKGARVVTDVITGRSKGYGFVRFGDELERTRAMAEMNGAYCSSRPMRISVATPKKSVVPIQQAVPKVTYPTPAFSAPVQPQSFATDNDPNNTTIFVGGLDPNVTDEELRQVFGQFGELIYVKIPIGKGCGFVQFTYRACAEEALQRLHGTLIGQHPIRLSWGRSPVNKQLPAAGWGQAQQDPSQWNAGYYGYGQSYDGYGYPPPQDPGYAYGSYAGYGTYHQPTDVQTGVSVNTSLTTVAEHKEEEIFDPLAPPDIDKLNAAYIALHEGHLLGRHLWLRNVEQAQTA